MNSSGAWNHAPPPLAARGFTRRREETWETADPEWLLLLCLRRCDLQQKGTTTTVDFNFFLVFFKSVFFLFFLSPPAASSSSDRLRSAPLSSFLNRRSVEEC